MLVRRSFNLLASGLLLLAMASCSNNGDHAAEIRAVDGLCGPDTSCVDVAVEPDSDAVSEPPAQLELSDGLGNRLLITTDPLGIVGFRGNDAVWDGADSPLRIGFVDDYDPATRYDPEMLPENIQWVALKNLVEHAEQPDGTTTLVYEPIPGRKIRLDIGPLGQGIATIHVVPQNRDGEVLTAIGYDAGSPEENFYGLGESFDAVARRGTHRHMHLSVDLAQESGYNEAHFPIPLLVSTTGSGIFVEDRHPGYFDVCESLPERVNISFSTHDLTFHLLFAESPLEVLSRYVAIAGKPALPPKWAFGVVQWQDEIDGQDMVMDDALSMREQDLPCSGIWIDRPFATAHESFVFDPDHYPDAEKMVDDLNDLGYRVAIWSAPYLSDDLEEEFAIAETNGYFVESADINFDKFGRLVDFTNPGLVELWQGLIQNATDIGIEGFKLDYGEDVITGYGPYKTTFAFFNGEGSETMHHWYHYFYHKTYREMIQGDAFLINRAGCYGDQTITSVCWPGDLCNNFKYHGEDGHVGGLPAAMIGNQTLSVSGYPFFGSDTGGYRHFRPSKEVLLRWVQHTALSPVLQFGGAGENCNPWDFTLYSGKDDGVDYVSQYDSETLDIWRKFARLHIRLFPYVYTYAVAASNTGIPVTRPYGMMYPELNQHPDFQYFYGDYFSVAPIYRPALEREVLIPPGKWIDWFRREAYEGPATKTLEVPLDSLILLVAEGAIIPMLRPSVDTLAPAIDPDVDSFANDPGTIVFRVFPAASASQFATVLGPEASVLPLEQGFEVSFAGIEPAFDGVRFEIDCLNLPDGSPDAIVVTSPGGAELTAAGSSAAVSNCAGCYHFDDDKVLHVAPTTADGKFTFHSTGSD